MEKIAQLKLDNDRTLIKVLDRAENKIIYIVDSKHLNRNVAPSITCADKYTNKEPDILRNLMTRRDELLAKSKVMESEGASDTKKFIELHSIIQSYDCCIHKILKDIMEDKHE